MSFELSYYCGPMKTISIDESKGLGNAKFIDVRVPEHFQQGTYEGAVNLCVHEIVFAEEVEKQFPDKAINLVLLGPSTEGLEAVKAYEILEGLDYVNVYVLDGGVRSLLGSSSEIPYDDRTMPVLCKSKYSLDPSSSRVRWLGRNIANNHTGTLQFSSGEFGGDNGDLSIETSSVVVDMNSIFCEDLKDEKMAGVLVDHLKHSDFFEVEAFPVATGKLVSFKRLNNPVNDENVELELELEIRGKVTRVKSLGTLVFSEGGNKMSLQGIFRFDRSQHGSIYGSKSFFHSLGGHLVNNFIEIDYTINAHADEK